MKKLWIQFKVWFKQGLQWLGTTISKSIKWLFNNKWFHLISVMFAFVGGLIGWLGIVYVILYLSGFAFVDMNKDK